MISGYKTVSIIYGGSGKKYADALNERIKEVAGEKRYPIQAAIINEKILTRELLTDVMGLFRQSEFCVVFLTEEDVCLTESGKKKRLRQNVVFELGMALIELGRERCLLMSDFDVKSADFDLPSDMNSLEIRCFKPEEVETVLGDIIETLLKFSRRSIVTGVKSEGIPNYGNLLLREEYRIDYENIFAERPITLAAEGSNFLTDTLKYWLSECGSLPYYDEKCVYLLERIGFLPMFGKVPAAVEFMEQAERLIDNYQDRDIRYYGGVELLDFTRNLIQCIIDYTILKTKDISEEGRIRGYETLLQNFTSEIMPEKTINPLIKVVYYDYIGLTYLRLYRMGCGKSNLENAKASFLKALEYVPSVDMSMQIWAGFLNYNYARVLAESGDADADAYYKKVIKIRSRWLKNSHYNITIRNALSYEYFIAKIDHIDAAVKFNLMTPAEVQNEYNYVEKELNTYSEIDEKLDGLIFIRNLLEERKNRQKG